jgi:hypothetical protein
MLKKIIHVSAFILLLSCSALLRAESVGYETLSPAQPTHNPDKIEVIEFFWYGCPHCYDFEPVLENWVKSLPKNVEFIRQPAVFSDLWGKHAKAYFTAEALGVVDKIHADFFDAIQNKNKNLKQKISWLNSLSRTMLKSPTSMRLITPFWLTPKCVRQPPLPVGTA